MVDDKYSEFTRHDKHTRVISKVHTQHCFHYVNLHTHIHCLSLSLPLSLSLSLSLSLPLLSLSLSLSLSPSPSPSLPLPLSLSPPFMTQSYASIQTHTISVVSQYLIVSIAIVIRQHCLSLKGQKQHCYHK